MHGEDSTKVLRKVYLEKTICLDASPASLPVSFTVIRSRANFARQKHQPFGMDFDCRLLDAELGSSTK